MDFHEELEKAITKLKEEIEKSPSFTPEEVDIIKKLINAYEGWLFTGSIVKWAVMALATLAAAVASFDDILTRIKTWFV